MPVDKLIVGLGNPTPKYDNTRHNAGFMAIDEITKEYDVLMKYSKKFQSEIGYKTIEGVDCAFLKPLTFMNCSGTAVESVKNFYKLNIKDIIIIYDDISFMPGIIKIKKKGSAGGHNGIKSIIYETGEEDFARIKIGVGAKPHKDYDLAKWVTSKFKEEENEKLSAAFEKTKIAIKLIILEKIDEAMNRFN